MEKTMTTNGPISVNGDMTPISKQQIDQIDATSWSDMSISDLYDQRTFLQTRLNLVLSHSGHPDSITAMQLGILNLEAIISSKEQQTNNSTDTSSNFGVF